jgi:phosphoglycolate/pyridoxal phosphate phosphatase family enzyme
MGNSSSAKKIPQKLADRESAKAMVDKFDNFLFDCDGVLWKGMSEIEGSSACINALKASGKRCFFVTNNAQKSRKGYVEKLKSFNIDADESSIIGSAFAAAQYLKGIEALANQSKKVYMIGAAGMSEELTNAGILHYGLEHSGKKGMPTSEEMKQDGSGGVAAVLVGLDFEINYYKLTYALNCVKYNPGCILVATNLDTTFPSADVLGAGGGVIGRALEVATNRKLDAACGKPSQDMMDIIIKTHNLDKSRSVMVGDRLDTDIDFGTKGGLSTILVMSGVTEKDEEYAPASNPVAIPDYVLPRIGSLVEFGVFEAFTGSTTPPAEDVKPEEPHTGPRHGSL